MNTVLWNRKNRYQCEFCLKTFERPSNLKRHIRTHTGEKPFTCEVCHKGFSLNANLQRHMLTHTGEKPFKCEICFKLFRHSSTLKMHLCIHDRHKENTPYQSDVNLYFCKWCDRTYKKTYYKYHRCVPNQGQRRVPMPSKCYVCGQERIDNIKLHMLLHEEYKPYECATCHLRFRTVSHWRQHVKNEQCEKHPITTYENQRN